MWLPTGNIHWNQRSRGSGRHITTPTEASAKTLSTRRTKVAQAKPWLAQWFRNRSRASADGPLRCRVTTAGFWNKVSNIVGSPLGTGEARPVSTIYLCGVRRGPHDHVKRVIRWPPHISGDHISHCARAHFMRENRTYSLSGGRWPAPRRLGAPPPTRPRWARPV